MTTSSVRPLIKPDVKAMLTEQILCYYPGEDNDLGGSEWQAMAHLTQSRRARSARSFLYLRGWRQRRYAGQRTGMARERDHICAAHEANMVLRCVLWSLDDEI